MSSGAPVPRSNDKAAYRITRRKGACRACRTRKVRCNGAKPCSNCERGFQECIYPDLILRTRKISNQSRAASCWSGIPQTTTLVSSPTLPSPFTPTSMRGEHFSWETTNNDLFSDMDLSSILETTDVINESLHEDDRFFTEIGAQSPPAMLESFEAVLPSSPRRSVEAIGNADDGNHEQQRSSWLEPPYSYRSMTMYSESLPDMSHQHASIESLVKTNETRALDFSAAGLYGLLGVIENGIPKSTSSKVTRFMQNLETLWGSMNIAMDQQDSSRAGWYLENEAMISEWCDVFVDEYPGFLKRPYIDNILERSRRTNAATGESAFVGAISAIGSYAALVREPSAPSSKALQKAYHRLSDILEYQRSVRNATDNLLKLQVLLLLVIVSSLCDQSMMGELITAAVQCARGLRLFQPWRTQARINKEEHELADTAVRFLYCIEVDHALHQGMPPLLDHDWISSTTSPGKVGQDHLVTDCTLFTLMQGVLRRQYSHSHSQADPCDSPLDQMKKLEFNEERLKEWLIGCIPGDDLDCISNSFRFQNRLNCATAVQRRRLLRIFYLYHRAIFFIYCPWIAPLTLKVNDSCVSSGSPRGTASVMRLRCIETALESAVALIQVASHLILSRTIQERDASRFQQASQELHQLLPTSLCLILFYLAYGGKKERLRVLPYLGVFGGLLGCIALTDELRTLLNDYFTILTSEGFV